MAVIKVNGFEAPYRSATFRNISLLTAGRNGLVDVKGEVTESGNTITVPPFSFVQEGLYVTKDTPTGVSKPNLAAPYFLVVSSPSPLKINDLVFTFVKSPNDLSRTETIVAGFDGVEWRFPEILSIAGVLDAMERQNITRSEIGAMGGLKTSATDDGWRISQGALIDRSGHRHTLKEAAEFPRVPLDPDYRRVDRILFRRATDAKARLGTREYIVGNTFVDGEPTPKAPVTLVDANEVTERSKVLIAPNNDAIVITARGYDNRYTLVMERVNADRTAIVGSRVDLTPSTHGAFDAAIDDDGILYLVFQTDGRTLDLLRYDTEAGAVLGTTHVTDSIDLRPSSEPSICLAPDKSRLFIVYKFTIAISSSRIYFKSVNLSGETVTGSKDISLAAGAARAPSLVVTDDLYAYVAWENKTNETISFRVFDDIGLPLDAMKPAVVVSGETTYGSQTLAGGASDPKITVTSSKEIIVSFIQRKLSGKRGVSVWRDGKAVMIDFIGAAEDIQAHDLIADEIIGGYLVDVAATGSVGYFRVHHDLVALTQVLSAVGSKFVAFARDKLGSLFHVIPHAGATRTVTTTTTWTEEVTVPGTGRGFQTDSIKALNFGQPTFTFDDANGTIALSPTRIVVAASRHPRRPYKVGDRVIAFNSTIPEHSNPRYITGVGVTGDYYHSINGGGVSTQATVLDVHPPYEEGNTEPYVWIDTFDTVTDVYAENYPVYFGPGTFSLNGIDHVVAANQLLVSKYEFHLQFPFDGDKVIVSNAAYPGNGGEKTVTAADWNAYWGSDYIQVTVDQNFAGHAGVAAASFRRLDFSGTPDTTETITHTETTTVTIPAEEYTPYESYNPVRYIGPALVSGATAVNLQANQILMKRTAVEVAVPRVGERIEIRNSQDNANNVQKIITLVEVVAFDGPDDCYRITCDSDFSSPEEGGSEVDPTIVAEFSRINGFDARGMKTVADSALLAFSTEEKHSDILLARITQPDGTILSWMPSDVARAASQTYLIPHGAVRIGWDGNSLTLSGPPLRLTNLFSDESYIVGSGSYALGESDALYVRLSRDHRNAAPIVTPITLLPWEDDIACLGFVMDGRFQGALLADGGVAEVMPGEEVTMGEDLPRGIRPRLGIPFGDNEFEVYTSDNIIYADDTYPEAISRLDATLHGYMNFEHPLTLSIHPTDTSRIRVSSAEAALPSGATEVLTLNGLVLSYEGAEIAFAGADAGRIFAADGVTEIGTFTVPASSDYRWFSVSLEAVTTDLTNRTLANLIVTSAEAPGGSIADAPRAPFDGQKPVGQFCVMSNAVAVAILQLGSGTGDGGGEGGFGEINYITSDTLSLSKGSSDNVALYNDGAAVPVDGAGGTPSGRLAFTLSQDDALFSKYSLLLTKAAGGSAQGEGLSIPVTVPRGYQRGQLSKIGYLFETSENFSNTEFQMFVFDVAGNAIITPKIMQHLTAGRGEFLATWEQRAGAEYRLLFHVKGTSAAAWYLKADKIVFGPGEAYHSFFDNSPQPAGSFQDYSGDVSAWPTVDGMKQKNGWAVGDGSLFDILKYPDLFREIGMTWNNCRKQDGTGGAYPNPPAGFARLPDVRGVFMRGVGTSSRADGTKDVTVGLAQFGDDMAALNGITLTGGAYSLSYSAPSLSLAFPTLKVDAPLSVSGTFAGPNHVHRLPYETDGEYFRATMSGLHAEFGNIALVNSLPRSVYGPRAGYFENSNTFNYALTHTPITTAGVHDVASPSVSGGNYSLNPGSYTFNAGGASLTGTAAAISTTNVETTGRWVGANRLVKLHSPAHISVAADNKRSPLGAGFVVYSASPKAKAGWLRANGEAYPKADFPDLWEEFGDHYATVVDTRTGLPRSAPPATHFRVPDYEGVYLRSAGVSKNQTTSLGQYLDDATARNGLTVSGGTASLSGTAPALAGSAPALAGSAPSLTGTTTFASADHKHAMPMNLVNEGIHWYTDSNNLGGTFGSNPVLHTGYSNFTDKNTGGDVTTHSPRMSLTAAAAATATVGIQGGAYSLTGGSYSLSGGNYTLTSVAAALSAGDSETRPESVGVYAYVKAWNDSIDLTGITLASEDRSGLVSTDEQNFAGKKNFVDGLSASAMSYRSITLLGDGDSIMGPGFYASSADFQNYTSLYPAAGNEGDIVEVKYIGPSGMTLAASGGEMIEGAPVRKLLPRDSARLLAIAGNWYLT